MSRLSMRSLRKYVLEKSSGYLLKGLESLLRFVNDKLVSPRYVLNRKMYEIWYLELLIKQILYMILLLYEADIAHVNISQWMDLHRELIDSSERPFQNTLDALSRHIEVEITEEDKTVVISYDDESVEPIVLFALQAVSVGQLLETGNYRISDIVPIQGMPLGNPSQSDGGAVPLFAIEISAKEVEFKLKDGLVHRGSIVNKIRLVPVLLSDTCRDSSQRTPSGYQKNEDLGNLRDYIRQIGRMLMIEPYSATVFVESPDNFVVVYHTPAGSILVNTSHHRLIDVLERFTREFGAEALDAPVPYKKIAEVHSGRYTTLIGSQYYDEVSDFLSGFSRRNPVYDVATILRAKKDSFTKALPTRVFREQADKFKRRLVWGADLFMLFIMGVAGVALLYSKGPAETIKTIFSKDTMETLLQGHSFAFAGFTSLIDTVKEYNISANPAIGEEMASRVGFDAPVFGNLFYGNARDYVDTLATLTIASLAMNKQGEISRRLASLIYDYISKHLYWLNGFWWPTTGRLLRGDDSSERDTLQYYAKRSPVPAKEFIDPRSSFGRRPMLSLSIEERLKLLADTLARHFGEVTVFDLRQQDWKLDEVVDHHYDGPQMLIVVSSQGTPIQAISVKVNGTLPRGSNNVFLAWVEITPPKGLYVSRTDVASWLNRFLNAIYNHLVANGVRLGQDDGSEIQRFKEDFLGGLPVA